MAYKINMNKTLSLKVNWLNECNKKFKEKLDVYVGQITGFAQMWIDKSEDEQSFLKITLQLDKAIMLLMEKTSEIENNLASQPLDTSTAMTALKSVTHLSPQTNVGAQATDSSVLCLLQERIDAFENLTGMYQELKAGLNGCRKQMGSVEGLKANVENLASQVEVMMNDKSLQQIQRDIDDYKSSEMIRILNIEDKLLKIEETLNITNRQVNKMNTLVNSLTDEGRRLSDSSPRTGGQLTDLEKSGEKTDETASQATAVNKKETQLHTTWTGFLANGKLYNRGYTRRNNLDVCTSSTNTIFDKKTNAYTAPVDGTYFVIFMHCQSGSQATTFKVMSSKETKWKDECLLTTSTSKENAYSVETRHITLSAGHRLYLSLPESFYSCDIPLFCCILVEQKMG